MSVINHRVDALEEALYNAEIAIKYQNKALNKNEQLSIIQLLETNVQNKGHEKIISCRVLFCVALSWLVIIVTVLVL